MSSSFLGEALKHLPHGPGFRFVDRLSRLEPGNYGQGEYHVRGDEPFLEAHFPGNPMFPGVLLVEAAAQLAGIVAQSDRRYSPIEDLRVSALRRVKITGSAVPGQTLILEASVVSRRDHLLLAQVAAYVGDTIVMEGEVSLGGAPAK